MRCLSCLFVFCVSLQFKLVNIFLTPRRINCYFCRSTSIRRRDPILGVPRISSCPTFRLKGFFNFSPMTNSLHPSNGSKFSGITRRMFIGRLKVFLYVFRRVKSKACGKRLSFRCVGRLQRFIRVTFARRITRLNLTKVVLNDLR